MDTQQKLLSMWKFSVSAVIELVVLNIVAIYFGVKIDGALVVAFSLAIGGTIAIGFKYVVFRAPTVREIRQFLCQYAIGVLVLFFVFTKSYKFLFQPLFWIYFASYLFGAYLYLNEQHLGKMIFQRRR